MHGFVNDKESIYPNLGKQEQKARIRREIGDEKERLKRISKIALNGQVEVLWYAKVHLERIAQLKNWLDELEAEEDAVDRFYRYIDEWDHDKGNIPEEYMAFYCIGEPLPELTAHEREKRRHAKRRLQKLHR